MAWNDHRITTVIQAIPFENVKIEILHSWFATSLSAVPTLSLSTLYSSTTDALNMTSCENESLTTKVFQEESKRNLSLGGSPRKRNNGEQSMEGWGVLCSTAALCFKKDQLAYLSGSLCKSKK